MVRSPREVLLLIVEAAWRRRILIVAPLLIVPLLGIVASFMVPKSYESRMTILIQEPAKLNPFMHDLSIGPNVKERMPALQALLHSDHILGKVAVDLGRVSDGSSGPERRRAVKALSGAVSVQLVGNDIMELRVRGPQGEGLSKILQAVHHRLVERLVAPESSAIGDSERFLVQQLDQRRGELEAAERSLTEFKAANAGRLPALYSSNVARVAGLRGKLEEKSMELAAADAGFADLRKRLAGTNPLIGRLEESIVQLSGEIVNLRARYTADHSEVIASERKLQRLQDERRQLIEAARSIDTEDLDRLWNIAAGMTQGDRTTTPLLVTQMQTLQEAQSRRASLRQDVEQLRKAVNEGEAAMTEFVPIEQRQQHLERRMTVARETYDALAKRYEMARVTGALGRFEAPERIKIIEAAGDPSAPSSPPRSVFVLAALAGGLLLGIALTAVSELIDPTLRHASDFAAAASVPVLARLRRIAPMPLRLAN